MMKKIYAVMGRRIKECRLEMGLSVKEVADIIHMKKASYISCEAGEKDMKISKLLLLSRLFHVSCDYLLGLTDAKWPPEEGKKETN